MKFQFCRRCSQPFKSPVLIHICRDCLQAEIDKEIGEAVARGRRLNDLAATRLYVSSHPKESET